VSTGLLRDTLDEWAGEARVPHDLADRGLRWRARWKPVGAAVLAMGLVAAVAVFVTGQREPEVTVRPANGITLPARPSPAPTDVRADTENNPPAKLIAAGRLAVSAYYTFHREPVAQDWDRLRRTWSLYDPRTDGYEKTSWAWVDVAPGLQVAAVLEGDLLSKRLGILDMNTRQVLKWFDLEHPAAAVSWSPDGTKVVATTYSGYPDLQPAEDGTLRPGPASGARTGFYVVDVVAGTADYHELAPMPDGSPVNMNGRQDLDWTLDGTMLWAPTSTTPDRVFYSLDGEPQDAPEGQSYVGYSRHSAVSPNGRLLLSADGLPTQITDRETGAIIGRQNVLQLHAWADDDDALALGCAGSCENEFTNGLVLVSADGKRRTQLTAYRDGDKDGAWSWVLTPR
jgi:hypothetical protein